ncbi:MAG: seryl-tRNA synthetase, partial [Actinomycetota bacterium]
VTTPQQAPEMLVELTNRVEATIAALGLPYRVLEICTGDLGQSHHRSFDIEVYAPGCDQWLEVSSISWFSDYQARRADIRFKQTGAKGSEIAHTLNASALAVPRVWAAILENFRQADGSVAAILENFRQADGSVAIPEVLQPYMRGAKVIAAKP